MIIRCTSQDVPAMLDVINDGARAYQGAIPADRWHEPYMTLRELGAEIDAGVEFWGWRDAGGLHGIMGIQDRGEVDLIRHAYVRTAVRRRGIGTRLLRHLEASTGKPILIGTWLAATWAITFYEKHGYVRLSPDDTVSLLQKYWNLPWRQIETSVVLAKSPGPRGLPTFTEA